MMTMTIEGLVYGLQFGLFWWMIMGNASHPSWLCRWLYHNVWRPLRQEYFSGRNHRMRQRNPPPLRRRLFFGHHHHLLQYDNFTNPTVDNIHMASTSAATVHPTPITRNDNDVNAPNEIITEESRSKIEQVAMTIKLLKQEQSSILQQTHSYQYGAGQQQQQQQHRLHQHRLTSNSNSNSNSNSPTSVIARRRICMICLEQCDDNENYVDDESDDDDYHSDDDRYHQKYKRDQYQCYHCNDDDDDKNKNSDDDADHHNHDHNHNTENAFLFLPCWHGYHEQCLQQWLLVKPSCPTCRLPIVSTTVR